MPPITVDPWRSLNHVETDVRHFLDDIGNGFTSSLNFDSINVPHTDVFEDDANLYITAELPGMLKGDVKISVSDHTLTIQGRSFSEFVREFGIPEACKEDQVQANFYDGLLEITIPKEKSEKLKDRVKEIPISSGKKALVMGKI